MKPLVHGSMVKQCQRLKQLGDVFLVQGVEAENEKMLHLIMETPDAETVAAFMSDEQFTADRIAAGVHVETTKSHVSQKIRITHSLKVGIDTLTPMLPM